VCLNLQHMVQVQGPDFWKKFCVCVVSDGRAKVNKGMKEYGEAHGFFDQNLLDESVSKMNEGELKVTMHLFEYTAQLKEDENFEKRFPPLQVRTTSAFSVFCLLATHSPLTSLLTPPPPRCR